jgi:hypothetical protein
METRTGVRPPRRQQRLVLAIGVIVLALMVAALVGLRLSGGGGTTRPPRGGLNSALPAAHFRPEKPMDKLGVYEKVDRDSARGLERDKVFGRFSLGASADSSAGKLLGQLDRLKQLLHPVGAAPGAVGPASPVGVGSAAPGIGLFRPAVAETPSRERLEELLRGMQRPDAGKSDPQLERLSGMLDKIIRIQHPTAGRADSNKPVAPGPAAMPLEKPGVESAVKDLAPDGGEEAGGFFGLDGEDVFDTLAAGNAFPAVIPEAQVLVAGATIALRLLQEARIGGVQVPQDELLYGKAALSGDRLLVNINSIRVGQSVYPVALQVYDLDGLAGIHVPGAITRDVLKQSAATGVSALGVVAADASLGAEAASAGIETARSLLSRKIALVRVTVPAGYRVLLRNQR